MRFIVLSASLLTFLLGCGKTASPSAKDSLQAAPGKTGAAQNDSATKAPRPLVTPSNDAIGKVVSVNQKARYAVLSYAIGTVPGIDTRVYAYRNGLKVGELRVSGPQRENNTIADLLAGECQAGDDVKGD
jgi:hypothetical protein